jgi:hypothetical protein
MNICIMCVLIISTKLSRKNLVKYYKCTKTFMYSTCYPCQILIKLEFFW